MKFLITLHRIFCFWKGYISFTYYNIHIHFILHNSKFQVFNVPKFQHVSFMIQKKSTYTGCFLTGGTSARRNKYTGCLINSDTRGRTVILHEQISKKCRIKFCRNPFSFRRLPLLLVWRAAFPLPQRNYPPSTKNCTSYTRRQNRLHFGNLATLHVTRTTELCLVTCNVANFRREADSGA